MIPRPPSSTLFPYTPLFRSQRELDALDREPRIAGHGELEHRGTLLRRGHEGRALERLLPRGDEPHVRAERLARRFRDRKSTRLNSSHSQISYAVFCLKKKKL